VELLCDKPNTVDHDTICHCVFNDSDANIYDKRPMGEVCDRNKHIKSKEECESVAHVKHFVE
jgi:hypothetical protein